jgi:hypothetical protein
MSDVKLSIKIPSSNIDMKITIDTLICLGYNKYYARLAVKNIIDKNNVDEAIEWLNKKKLYKDI